MLTCKKLLNSSLQRIIRYHGMTALLVARTPPMGSPYPWWASGINATTAAIQVIKRFRLVTGNLHLVYCAVRVVNIIFHPS